MFWGTFYHFLRSNTTFSGVLKIFFPAEGLYSLQINIRHNCSIKYSKLSARLWPKQWKYNTFTSVHLAGEINSFLDFKIENGIGVTCRDASASKNTFAPYYNYVHWRNLQNLAWPEPRPVCEQNIVILLSMNSMMFLGANPCPWQLEIPSLRNSCPLAPDQPRATSASGQIAQ